DERNRKASLENIWKIAVAAHGYGALKAYALPADITGKDGKRLLSWRVALLPYMSPVVVGALDEAAPGRHRIMPITPDYVRAETKTAALFKRFKLDEPWNSKHNLALLKEMPPVYASPRVTLKQKGYTVYQVFSGPGALFQSGKSKYKLGNIPDGRSNT